jgi:hypothetical protein
MAYLDTSKASSPSVVVSTLGEEATFTECLLVHPTKVLTKGLAGDLFVER